jgi:uncharacterized repeat protein (TIGR01451 family)
MNHVKFLVGIALIVAMIGLAVYPAGAQQGGGDTRPSDFGDAPASYELSGGGGLPARHVISQFRLGALVDAEGGPQPSNYADGDGEDEDGIVVSPNPLVACGQARVTASPSAPGYLNAWADFNGNGQFDSGGVTNPGEHIIDRMIAPGGTTADPEFTVPCDSTGSLIVRFRFDAEGNLGPTNDASGYVPYGEVEDYHFPVISGADLAIEKTDHQDTVQAGTTLTYEITVTNHGPLTATSVRVDDLLPPAVTYLSSNPPGLCNLQGDGTLRCHLPNMIIGKTLTLLVTVVVANTSGVLENVATVTANQPDPNLDNNEAVDLTTVLSSGGLDFGDAPAAYAQIAQHSVAPGDSLRLGTLDTELGHQPSPPDHADADDLGNIDDEDGINFPATLGRNGHVAFNVYPTGSGYLSGWIDTDGSNSWDPGEKIVPAHRVTKLDDPPLPTRLTFAVPPGTAANAIARFRFSTDEGLGPAGHAMDGEVEDYAATLTEDADLAVAKTANPAPVCTGAEIEYIVTVTNNGPNRATGVTMVDNLGAGHTVIGGSLTNTPSTSVGAWACTIVENDSRVSCTLGSLDAGSTVTIRYRAAVTAPAGAVVSNQAVVTSTSHDPEQANNTAQVETAVQACPLLIKKTDNIDPVVAGERFKYTVTITNPGPNPVFTATMVDHLPAEATYVSATPSGDGSCERTLGNVVCIWPTLPVGVSQTAVIEVEATATLEPVSCVTVLNYAMVQALDGVGGAVGPVSTIEPTEICSRCSVDVILTYDVSGSMSYPFSGGGGQKLAGAQEAGLQFSQDLKDPEEPSLYIRPSQVGLASFRDHVGTVEHPLTDLRAGVEAKIEALTPNGATDTSVGLEAAIREITSIRHRPSNISVIVFFSDGENSLDLPSFDPVVADQKTRDLALAAKAAGIRIAAIAIDPDGPSDSQLMKDIATPGLYFEAFSKDELVDVYTAIRVQVCGDGGEGEDPPEPCGDLGDAPDSSNHFNVPMKAYAGPPQVPAFYPTVFEPVGSPPGAPGPRHAFSREDIFLGLEVSCEDEADQGPDEDGDNNLDPPLNLPNLDLKDDALFQAQPLPNCRPTSFQYRVTAAKDTETRFVNAWIDFNRDGDWADTLTCFDPLRQQTITVPEWVMQDQAIALSEGLHTLTSPIFESAPAGQIGAPTDLWLRLMLSEHPAPPAGPDLPADGRGTLGGFDYGETEDYRLIRTPGTVVFTAH